MSRRVVLVTGASGLLGTWLRRTVPAGVELVSSTHRTAVTGPSVRADLRDRHAVVRAFEQVAPSLVLHAAMAVDEPSIVDATRHVVEAAAHVGADVLHVSTDAVFSGDGRPLEEQAQPDPIWDYGRWKAEAETLVLHGSDRSAIVRLPLVISLDPVDHAVKRIQHGASTTQPTRWFDDELRQPAMATDLAAALWQIAALASEDRSGAWQLPGPETLSRYEIAQRVVAALGLDREVVTPEPTPPGAGRPRHLDLRSDRAQAAIGWDPTPILS